MRTSCLRQTRMQTVSACTAKDTKTGEYVTFTGNMSGMLIAEYILREKKAMGTMPENPAHWLRRS